MPIKYIPPILLSGLFILLQPGNLYLRNTLEFERSGILIGELWRLLTGHFVHLDATHALLNILAILLFSILYGRKLNILQWLILSIIIPLGISIIILFLFPRIEWFAGFSGAIHGFFLCCSLSAWSRDKPEHAIVFTLILIKVVLEQSFGSFSSTMELMSSPVLAETHTAGAIVSIPIGITMRLRNIK